MTNNSQNSRKSKQFKICATCKEAKPFAEFDKNSRTMDGLDNRCKSCKVQGAKPNKCADCGIPVAGTRCRSCTMKANQMKGSLPIGDKPMTVAERQKRWYSKNPQKASQKRRKATLAQYNLTPQGFQDILNKQGGKCAICGSNNPNHWSGRFHVDHCHDTGMVRGLLCASCNTGIGLLQENPEILKNAIDYLLRSSVKTRG